MVAVPVRIPQIVGPQVAFQNGMQVIQELALVSLSLPQISVHHLRLGAQFQGTWTELIEYLGIEALEPDLDRVRRLDSFKELARWFKASHSRLTIWGDADYPTALQSWPDAPTLIWYQGEPAWRTRNFISVVGSRNPSLVGLEWMNWQLPEFLTDVDVGVVSGGARGIDQRAHLLAIRSRKPTIALMPVGLKSRYPYSFREYEAAILETGGAVVSLFPPGYPLYRSNFAVRNHVIAALSPLTLIVEARRRSGTMVTAQAALSLGREVLTLPTFPLSCSGQGNLDLLADGATLIRDAKDLKVAWSRGAGTPHRPPSEIGEDDIHSPNGDTWG